jgi:hypothetical protein
VNFNILQQSPGGGVLTVAQFLAGQLDWQA